MKKTIDITTKAQLKKVRKMFAEMLDSAFVAEEEGKISNVHDACRLVIRMIDAVDSFENLRDSKETQTISFSNYSKHQEAAFAYGFQNDLGIYDDFSIKTTFDLNSFTFSYKNLKAFASYILKMFNEAGCTKSFEYDYEDLFDDVELVAAVVEDDSEEKSSEVKKFEVGKTYKTTSNCDSNFIYTFEIVKRTEKTVTTINKYGEQKLYRVRVIDDVETFSMGRYSMAPSVNANDGKETPEKPFTAHFHTFDGTDGDVTSSFDTQSAEVATVKEANDLADIQSIDTTEMEEQEESTANIILDKIACTVAYSEKIGSREAINAIYGFCKEAESKGLVDLARKVKFKTLTACWYDNLNNFYVEDYLKLLA